MANNPPYDSHNDILIHQERVSQLLREVLDNLVCRSMHHDDSKLGPAEKPFFDECTPALKGLEYGSKEYQAQLAKLKPALNHHYLLNPHHPEFHPGRMKEMSLLDLLEMLADWKAAAERHLREDHNLAHSLGINRARFHIPDQIYLQLITTALELGWLSGSEALLLLPDGLRGTPVLWRLKKNERQRPMANWEGSYKEGRKVMIEARRNELWRKFNRRLQDHLGHPLDCPSSAEMLQQQRIVESILDAVAEQMEDELETIRDCIREIRNEDRNELPGGDE